MTITTQLEAARLHDSLAQFGNRDLRIQMIGIALAAERKATVERIADLWKRGFQEASWGHGKRCNIHTQQVPGAGCTCVFGELNVAILDAEAAR